MGKAPIGIGTFYAFAQRGGYQGPPVNLAALDRELSKAVRLDKPGNNGLALFPAYTLAELAALPEMTWLIEGVLPESSLCMVYGPSGSLKTFLVLAWALNGAAGRAWAGGELAALRGFNITRRLSAAIIAGEGARGLRKRVQAWQKHNLVDESELDVIVIPQMPSFGRAGDVEQLIATIRNKQEFTDIVIVDTVMRASSGLNLNNPAESQVFIDACERIKRELNCSVVLVHHTGKDRERGHLGAENLKAAMDSMERVDLVLRASGTRIIRVRQEKAKDTDEREDIYLLAELVAVGKTADGNDVTSLVLNRCEKPSASSASKDTAKLDVALGIIRQHGETGVKTKALAEEMAIQLNGATLDPLLLSKKAEVMRKWITLEARPGGQLNRLSTSIGKGETAARLFRVPKQSDGLEEIQF